EVNGLDRPGLLYELTATLSKLNLNIASAHVATFGERVVDVFYVTDLLGAKIESAPRQATIKRALIQLFAAPADSPKPAKAATACPVPRSLTPPLSGPVSPAEGRRRARACAWGPKTKGAEAEEGWGAPRAPVRCFPDPGLRAAAAPARPARRSGPRRVP